MKEKAIGQALDLDDCVSGSLCGKDVSIRAGSYEELHDADIMVMAFGRSRRPDETRLDMFDDSIKMANEVVSHLKQIDFRGIMISISNPADIICEYIRRQMDWGLPAASVQWQPDGLPAAGNLEAPPVTTPFYSRLLYG